MPYCTLPRLSCIMPLYFNQGDVCHFHDLLMRYNDCPAAVRQYLQFVLVDDCSAEQITIPPQINLNIKLYRILDDIPWNQSGAKNLGITMSPTSKILSTDVDHYIPPELLGTLLEIPTPCRQIFVFERETEYGEKIKSHKNTFFTSKSTFFESLGYDEQFCGNYGQDDNMFLLLQQYMGVRVMPFDRQYSVKYLEYGGKHHSLKRDGAVNRKLFETYREVLRSTKDPLLCHSRLFLNFKWQFVEEKFYRP